MWDFKFWCELCGICNANCTHPQFKWNRKHSVLIIINWVINLDIDLDYKECGGQETTIVTTKWLTQLIYKRNDKNSTMEKLNNRLKDNKDQTRLLLIWEQFSQGTRDRIKKLKTLRHILLLQLSLSCSSINIFSQFFWIPLSIALPLLLWTFFPSFFPQLARSPLDLGDIVPSLFCSATLSSWNWTFGGIFTVQAS